MCGVKFSLSSIFGSFSVAKRPDQGEQNRMLVVKARSDEIMTSLVVDQVLGIVPSPPHTRIHPPPRHTAKPRHISMASTSMGARYAVFDLERFLLSLLQSASLSRGLQKGHQSVMNVYMDRTMPTNLDHKILTGFTQEAQSYLPKIREGIESFLHDTQQNAALEAACQHVHAIKGASEMLELLVLSQVTSYIQEMLGKMVVVPGQVEPHTRTCLRCRQPA